MPTGIGGEQLWLCPSINDSANDISGNGNNGVYQGGMGTVISDGSLAYDFDGSDDYIDFGDILDGTTGGQDDAVTYSSWMKLDSYSNNINGNGTGWMGKCDDVVEGGLLLNNLNGKIYLGRYPDLSPGGNVLQTATNASQVPVSTWKHVAVTYSGCETTGCTSIYVDGVAVSATDTINNYGNGMGTNTDSFKIGTTLDAMAFKRMMNGQLDDIRVYNRAITQAEITHLATSRGIEGPAPVGLGTEKTWLCPSLLDAPTDITGNKTYTYGGGLATVANTESGGSRAYDFDRSAAKGVFQSASEVMDDTDSFAVSCWMNISTLSTDNYYILDCRSGSGQGFLLLLRSTGGQAYLGTLIVRGTSVINTSSIAFGETSAEFINTPRFCVINWDNVAKTWTLYNDGVFVGSFSPAVSGGSAVSAGTHCAVGNYPVSPGTIYPPIGLVDDLRVHDRVLSQSEITHLATSRGVLGPPGGATHYNPFKSHAFINNFQQRLR